jgi:hypothetical protein
LFANLLAAVNAHPYVPNSSDKLKALLCYRRGRSARSRAGCRTGAWPWFRARLEQIINLRHELAQLAGQIDWDFIDGEIAPLYSDKGRPGIPTRFAIGLLLLKQIYGLSDEGVCERWVYDPYFQYFTGEEFFQHEFPHERSDLSHWRKRLGDKLELLLAESLRVAHEFAEPRPQAGHDRHHRAAQERQLPDRCQAAPQVLSRAFCNASVQAVSRYCDAV